MQRPNHPPSSPEENRARNIARIARIMNPPKPALADRIRRRAYEVRDLWQRHVSQRELTRMLDRARLVPRPERDPQVGLDRLRAEYPGRYPGDPGDR